MNIHIIIMTLLQHIIKLISTSIYFLVCCIVFQWHCCTKFALHEMLEPGPSTWLSFAVPLRHCVMQPIQLVIWHSTGGIREKCVGKSWTWHWCHEVSIGILKNNSLLPPSVSFSSFRVVTETENQTTPPTYHDITKNKMKHTFSWFPTNSLKLTPWHQKQGVWKMTFPSLDGIFSLSNEVLKPKVCQGLGVFKPKGSLLQISRSHFLNLWFLWILPAPVSFPPVCAPSTAHYETHVWNSHRCLELTILLVQGTVSGKNTTKTWSIVGIAESKRCWTSNKFQT